MADQYIPNAPPDEYTQQFFVDELARISAFLNDIESPRINLIPLAAVPDKYKEGDVVYADGTNWNPGSGAGLYERTASAWSKL